MSTTAASEPQKKSDYWWDKYLRQQLKEKYDVPDEFMDLAVQIWWDGKED